MGKKSSRKHDPSRKDQSTASEYTQWPNLPQQLIDSIARQPKLMQNITSFGVVITKSWRSPSRQCNPGGRPRWSQLVEVDGREHPKTSGSYIWEIPFLEEYPYSYYKRRSHKDCYQWRHFKGHSHGQVIKIEAGLGQECRLWHPAWRCWRYLEPWDRNLPVRGATLSSFPDDPGAMHPRNRFNVMVLTDNCSPAFAFSRWGKGEKAWTLQDCTVKDPYGNNEDMEFVNAIGFRGKFYALSLQGSLVVIEDIDSCFRITTTGASRAVPSKASRQFREYLLESNGEILLVFLISRKSIDLVEDVEVFRLDVHKLLWVKVESLGDWTLFLEDECCMGVDASQVGCRNNSVYFTHHRTDKWWIFDMENGQISPAFDPEGQESTVWYGQVKEE